MNTNAVLQRFSLLVVSLMIITLSSCNKDDETAAPKYGVKDFVGSWIATSYVHTDNTNASQSVDLVAIGGEVRFTMLNGGGTRTWVELGTFSDEWDALITISGNTVTSTPEEPARSVKVSTFEYDGTTLTLTNPNDSFDFTLGGNSPTSSTSIGTFVRQ